MMRVSVWLPVFLFYSVLATAGPGGDRLLSLYRHADSLYHLTQSSPASDSLALAGFSTVAGELEKAGHHGGDDTLLIGALLKKGILLDAGGDYARARIAYCKVLGYRPPSDSLVFVTQVLIGTAYYNLGHFDSASYFLLRAESLVNRFMDRDNSVRLYNTLGALYYAIGNYRQSKNYFDHALGIVSSVKPYDTAAAVSLQMNIATSLFRVGEFPEALATYRQLLFYRPLADYVYLNMGRAFAGLGNYSAAMDYFRRVKAGRLPGVLNEMANAQLQLHRPDSCEWYLKRLQDLARRDPARTHPLDLGINALYAAEELSQRREYMAALASLQQAIILFSRNFSNTGIYANPSNFAGAFAYYRLFDALVRKAELFELLYRSGLREEKNLVASYAAYTAALSLLRYIEKSYATDEAKLFLKKKSGPVHEEALSVCLRLSRLHPGGKYLEQAFLLAEKSKASVMTANLEEKAFMGVSGGEQELLQKVNNCKYHIARLNVRSEATTDSGELAAITGEKEGEETELLRLQKLLEQNGEYYRLKYGDASPGVRDLALEENQALISLYAAAGVLHIFVVTRDGLVYAAIDSLTGLQRDVESWLSALKTTGNGHRFAGEAIGRRLYTKLVRPIQAAARGKTEWIIIPDGLFALLPFESLPADEEGKQWLVETTTISYRFSSRLLNAGDGGVTGGGGGVLAFAPFAGGGISGAGGGAGKGGGGGSVFERLPASGEEIAGLPGIQYLDSRATKEQFLKAINHYPIVHLATHAVSSMDNAAASFIAFYPSKHSAIEDRLFLEELYGLNLRATRLVIISACETGQGEVAPQEGVISLARAFVYAGCGSTINSLWKADDQATSIILRRFYVYLQRGETKARALQLAKLDYLKSDAIDKSPAYWAHLMLTGDSAPLYRKSYWVQSLLSLTVLGVVWFVVGWKRRGKKKSRRI